MRKPDADQKHPTLRDAVSPLALTGLDQPLWLQNSSYPASLDRLLVTSALETGVQGLTELAVSQRGAGANMSVDVGAGRAVIPLTDAPNQGSVLVRSTVVNNLVVSGAPAAGLQRRDLIVARVYDASLIGGSINGWQLEVVTGTPAASPTVPSAPTSSLVLAEIAVAAGQATVTTANITDRRAMPGVWRDWTPVWTGATANPSLGAGGLIAGRYVVRNKLCVFTMRIVFGATPGGGGGGLYLTLPVPARSAPAAIGNGQLFTPSNASNWLGLAWQNDSTHFTMLFTRQATSTLAAIWQATNPGDGTAGNSIPQIPGGYCVQSNGEMYASGTYEAA